MRSLHAGLVLVVLVSAACEGPAAPAFGALRVSVATTGGDPDLDGYRLLVDTTVEQAVGPNGTVLVPDLATGIHAAVLDDVAGNCTVDNGSLRLLVVTAGDTAEVAFAVDCVATGLQISIATVGVDTADHYTLTVDGTPPIPVPVSGTVTVTRLAAGRIPVILSGVPGNCTLADPNPRFVDVGPGVVQPVAIAVTCLAITGVVEVAITTSGLDLDPDGYTLQLDSGAPQPVGAAETVRFDGVGAGSHDVTIAGAAANCTVGGGPNPRTVTVTVGATTRDTARASFQLSCTAVSGVIEVTAATSGLDLDANGYSVRLDGGAPQAVGLNGVTRFGGVSGGAHAIALDDAAANCTVANNPDTLTVTTGGLTRDTARVTFPVTCGAVTGVIAVTAATAGVDLDQNGYSVYVDSGTPQQLAVNGTVYFAGVSGGSHDVWLGDASHNCIVAGANPRTVGIAIGGMTRDTARSTFDVACEAATGDARIITATTGADLDPDGYWLGVDCYDYYGYRYCAYEEQVAANDTTVLAALPSGSHIFDLQSTAPNCDVSGGNPRTVHVAGAATTDIVFPVTCLALGSMQVTATTTGVDLDGNGYRAAADGPRQDSGVDVPANGTGTMSGLAPGDYRVSLGDAALNCDIAGPNPVIVTVPSGGVGTASFSVACATASQLAYTTNVDGNAEIYVIKSNGAGAARLTMNSALDEQPTWSPGGTKIAFTSDRDGDREVYVMNADGSGPVRLTSVAGADFSPAWSPDGSKIAFTSERDGNAEIYVMDADGLNAARLTNDVGYDDEPAWSPDGTKIAFRSHRDGHAQIYVMNANGSGATRLTSTGADDHYPTWSPDGAKIAYQRLMGCYYYCDYDLFVMNADGSGMTQLASGSSDTNPAWSPDGRWIAYGAEFCDYYYGCYAYALAVVTPDATRRVEVTSSPATYPAWRP